MPHDSTTGRRKTIEVTADMIEAAARELLRFDPEFGTARQGAERLLCVALSAGGYGFNVSIADPLPA